MASASGARECVRGSAHVRAFSVRHRAVPCNPHTPYRRHFARGPTGSVGQSARAGTPPGLVTASGALSLRAVIAFHALTPRASSRTGTPAPGCLPGTPAPGLGHLSVVGVPCDGALHFRCPPARPTACRARTSRHTLHSSPCRTHQDATASRGAHRARGSSATRDRSPSACAYGATAPHVYGRSRGPLTAHSRATWASSARSTSARADAPHCAYPSCRAACATSSHRTVRRAATCCRSYACAANRPSPDPHLG